MFHVEGPLSFGSAKAVNRLLTTSAKKDILLIDLADVPFIDSSASTALEKIIVDALKIENQVILCGVRDGVARVLRKIGVLGLIRPGLVLAERAQALRMADMLLESNSGEPEA